MTSLHQTIPGTGSAASPCSVLLIEDDDASARRVHRSLTRNHRFAARICRAATLREAREAIESREERFDIALLDLGLPDGQGVGNLEYLLSVDPLLPVIILSGNDNEDRAIAALSMGAQDYVVKGSCTDLEFQKSIRFSMERHRLRCEVDAALMRENEVKDRLLSHVSHELRTPLTAVMQFASILRDGIAGHVSDQQAEYLDIVLRNADQLKRMISTLMDATRASVSKLTCDRSLIDPMEFLTAAYDSVLDTARNKGVALSFDRSTELPEIVGDAGRLQQVVVNLLENAIKFSPAGSEVRVTAGVNEREITVSVRDDGPSIPEDAIAHIFDRLFQVEDQADVCRKGLGLSLYLARELVTLHQGRIWADSVPGQGSTFHISLPRWSLADQVAHVALVDGKLHESIGLVAVDLRPTTRQAQARGVDLEIRQATALLEKCMIGLTDRILPRRKGAPTGAVLFALTRANAAGNKSIASRFEREFVRAADPATQVVSAVVHHACFPIRPMAGQGVREVIVELTQNIRAAMSALETGEQ